MLPLPILLAGAAVLGYILFGSPASPLSPSQSGSPPPPAPPGGGGSTPSPGGGYGGGGDSVPNFVPGFGADTPVGPAVLGSGPNSYELAPWFLDPYGAPTVPMTNFDPMGPAATTTGPQVPAPPTPMHQIRQSGRPAHVGGGWNRNGRPWDDQTQPQFLADGTAIFRNTAGDIVYVGPWWGGREAF